MWLPSSIQHMSHDAGEKKIHKTFFQQRITISTQEINKFDETGNRFKSPFKQGLLAITHAKAFDSKDSLCLLKKLQGRRF